MTDLSYYILPGESRTKDRIVRACDVSIEHYSPSRDQSLPAEERQYRPNVIIATVTGESAITLPFALPVYADPTWTDLPTAAKEMGCALFVGDPIKDDDEISRAIIRFWFATADGKVYTAKKYWPKDGDEFLSVEQWPIHLAPEWCSVAKAA